MLRKMTAEQFQSKSFNYEASYLTYIRFVKKSLEQHLEVLTKSTENGDSLKEKVIQFFVCLFNIVNNNNNILIYHPHISFIHSDRRI